MKFLTSLFKSSTTITHIAALAGIALSFSACKSNDTPSPGIAALAITYAVPDGENVNFYLDNAKVNASPFSFGNKVDYFQVYEGIRNARVHKANDNNVVLNEDINLIPGEYYSLYIVNKVANIEYLLINDKVTSSPAAGKAKVRFLNLAPDATALDLVIEGETAKFENKAFKGYTEFTDVAENNTATLKLINRANGNAVVATLNDVELKSGSIYSVWAKGLLTTSETPQEIAIKVSKH